jgi:formylglycine-generating enzyme required for sulfatase activity
MTKLGNFLRAHTAEGMGGTFKVLFWKPPFRSRAQTPPPVSPLLSQRVKAIAANAFWLLLAFSALSACKQRATPIDSGVDHGKRVALIIGNENYKKLQRLPACRHDAEKMTEIFQKIGVKIFREKPLLDVTANEMDEALNAFAQSLQSGSEAYIYFSGHGAQIEGANYLLPVNFDAAYEGEAKRDAIALEYLLALFAKTPSRLRVVILDACRDPGNLLPGEPTQKGFHDKGFAEQSVEAPETLVCFATKHGTAALANEKASFYTRILAEEMVRPGTIEDVMKNVMRRVMKATHNKQVPFTYGNLTQDHFFVAPSAPDDAAARKLSAGVPPGSAPAATMASPFVNTLGLEFVPLPGTNALICRTDVRVRDFRAYVEATGYRQSGGANVLRVKKSDTEGHVASWEADPAASWERPGFMQEDDHPVVCVSWGEAKAFCDWLSKKEGRNYRLPKDAEWSACVGDGRYPWGDYFPPEPSDGNYGDRSYIEYLNSMSDGEKWSGLLENEDDGYATTAPVGSYQANQYGLFDMGGNVSQWCEDEYRAAVNPPDALRRFRFLKSERGRDGTPYRVLRGGSWYYLNYVSELALRSLFRNYDLPTARSGLNGFRCVLAPAGG